MPKKLRNVLAILLVLSLFFSGTVLAQVSPALRDPGGGGGINLTKPIKSVTEVKNSVKSPVIKEYLEAQEKAVLSQEVSRQSFTGGVVTDTMIELTLASGVGTMDGEGNYTAGIIPSAAGFVAAMYSHPPASAQSYVAYVMDSVGIAQPAYAQGLGFSALSPILSAWIVFRNIAYFFFVAVFVVIGFMIMFRQKISGQAVVTAQQAIPSIIIALVAVTFSYAIAGFLIEIMYLIMFLIVGLFQKNPGQFIDGNIFQAGAAIVSTNVFTVGETVSSFVNESLGGGIVSNALGIVSGVLLMLLFSVAILVSVLRILVILLKRYISVIASVILAPIILMIGAIPGRNTFGPWLRGIIGNLAAFPTLLIALVVSDVITGNFSGATQAVEYGGFLPPYLTGVGTSGHVNFLIGLGILLVLPEIIDKVSQLAGAGKGPFDELVGAAIKSLHAGDEALPVLAGGAAAAGGAYQGARAAARSRDQNTMRGIWRAAKRGYIERDDEGHVVRTVGGAVPRAQAGLRLGGDIRRHITDLEKGRFFQTDNYARMLEDIRRSQMEGTDKKDEVREKLETPVN